MFRIVPQLVVSDLPRSVRFYTHRFGFTVSEEQPDFVSLEREDAELWLVAASSREEAQQAAELGTNKHGVGVRLFVEVDDARELYEELQEDGVPGLGELTGDETQDYIEFVLVDPDGYEIGVYS